MVVTGCRTGISVILVLVTFLHPNIQVTLADLSTKTVEAATEISELALLQESGNRSQDVLSSTSTLDVTSGKLFNATSGGIQGQGQTSESPQRETPRASKCFPGFVCYNGYCSGAFSCSCYGGWAGLTCQSKCPADCLNSKARCVTGSNNVAECRCTDEAAVYTPGHGCVLAQKDEIDIAASSLPVDLATNQLSPFAERECFAGFVCVHGACLLGALPCECDPGWKGQLCDQPCPLNCGPNGRCRETQEYPRILYCQCSVGYNGSLCETSLRDNHTTAAAAVPDRTDRLLTRVPSTSSYFDTTSSALDSPDSQRGRAVGLVHGEGAMVESWFARLIMGALLTLPPPAAAVTTTSATDSASSQDLPAGIPAVQNSTDKRAGVLATPEAEGADTVVETPRHQLFGGSLELESAINKSVEARSLHMGLGMSEVNGSVSDPGSFSGSQDLEWALDQSPETHDSTWINIRPQEDRMCLTVICLWGFCDRTTNECVCDEGWSKPLCDQRCSPSCPAPQVCNEVDYETPTCECLPNHTGDLCPGGEPETNTKQPEMSLEPTPQLTENSNYLHWEPVEGFGPLPPLEQRICEDYPFFTCRYGNCTLENQAIHCICEPSFTNTLCETPCTMDCGERGKCQFVHDKGSNGNDTEICTCEDNRYAGPMCATLIQREVTGALSSSSMPTGLKAALAVLAVLLACLLVLAVLFYLLWRRRNIFMMKIVYWFRGFEEDDSRDCDAFVSYASADLDRQFVIQVLVPKLEGRMCFTLCLHQRDFLPGQYISHNISESIKRSRRTIIVVSPAYVNSNWCQFEFQMALQEMVNQKHRILPILLDDVSNLKKDMDEILKKVLEAVTWIEYPGRGSSEKEFEQFWRRIELSMPKKRTRSPEEGPSIPQQQSCLTSPGSPISETSPSPTKDVDNFRLLPNRQQSFPSDAGAEPNDEALTLRQIVRVPEKLLDQTMPARRRRSSLQKFFNCFPGPSRESHALPTQFVGQRDTVSTISQGQSSSTHISRVSAEDLLSNGNGASYKLDSGYHSHSEGDDATRSEHFRPSGEYNARDNGAKHFQNGGTRDVLKGHTRQTTYLNGDVCESRTSGNESSGSSNNTCCEMSESEREKAQNFKKSQRQQRVGPGGDQETSKQISVDNYLGSPSPNNIDTWI